ncbi:hypothetical protein TWF694_001771 [Orbilia ellipsospora]|uniref:HPt domain-containing protein n=1 Tax=Orbilia ellipsospora TaxID=2528407 RepID=A0AAV9X3L5_9PEZI
MSDDEYDLPADAKQYVDTETFEQILEMDDGDPDRDFSKGLVEGFFEQAENTFDNMDTDLQNKNLLGLSALGHFLKGSSATLGIYKVRDHCEKIQNWGAMKDATGLKPLPDEETALKLIAEIIPEMKEDYDSAKNWLEKYFQSNPLAPEE